MTNTKAGFIAVVGLPNAGKSSFVNKMVGERIAIVTPKVQTTRQRILGITSHKSSQLIFMDTPGIFKAKESFEKAMVEVALSSINDADIIALMIDANKGFRDDDKMIIDACKTCSAKKIIILNKVDKVAKPDLLLIAKDIFDYHVFDELFMISALKGDGVSDVKAWIADNLPNDAWHYPEDQITDMPTRNWAAEVTRESLFFRLREELPYSVAVETESYEERSGSVKIRQIIHVQSENQKKIVLGKNASMLKEVGTASRIRIERFLQQKVHLMLFVKVSENWKDGYFKQG